MGGFLDKPETSKVMKHGEGNGLRYGIAAMQGWRLKMEDRYDAKITLGNNLDNWSYFGVFDGHAGDKVSTYCSEHLLLSIVVSEELFQRDINQCIQNGFLHLDEEMRTLPEIISGEDRSGTTAVCAFISPKMIYIANCGDSRAVLCRSGEAFLTTIDHRPRLTKEHIRIVKAGLEVENGRVAGRLAVSRALGDYSYKNIEGLNACEQPVSPEPEIFEIERDASDEFLILASDGIWNVMNDDDICRYVRSRLLLTNQLEEVASQVLDTCLYKNGDDNMTVIVITFPGAPALSQEAIQAEQELDTNIERLLKEVIAQSTDNDYGEVIWNLRNLHIAGLPAGGGIDSKGLYITQLYKQLCPEQAHTATVSRF